MADWADTKAGKIIEASDPKLYPHSIAVYIADALRDAYEAGKAERSESILNLLREIRHDSTTVLRAGYFQEIDGLVLADDIRKSHGAPRLPGM